MVLDKKDANIRKAGTGGAVTINQKDSGTNRPTTIQAQTLEQAATVSMFDAKFNQKIANNDSIIWRSQNTGDIIVSVYPESVQSPVKTYLIDKNGNYKLL